MKTKSGIIIYCASKFMVDDTRWWTIRNFTARKASADYLFVREFHSSLSSPRSLFELWNSRTKISSAIMDVFSCLSILNWCRLVETDTKDHCPIPQRRTNGHEQPNMLLACVAHLSYAINHFHGYTPSAHNVTRN